MFGVSIKKILSYFLGSLGLAFLFAISQSLKNKNNSGLDDRLFDYVFFGINFGYLLMFLIFILLFVGLLGNEIQNQKTLNNRSFVKITETGFKNLSYPILGYGGFLDPSVLDSYDEYLEKINKTGQWGVAYIIDSNLSYYEIIRKSSKNNETNFFYDDITLVKKLSIDEIKKLLIRRYEPMFLGFSVDTLMISAHSMKGIRPKLSPVGSFGDLLDLFR